MNKHVCPDDYFRFSEYKYRSTPEMVWEADGEHGDEEDDGGERQQVQEVPHHQLLQLLPAGDLAGVVLLEHLKREVSKAFINNKYYVVPAMVKLNNVDTR